jgi:hypothetical protein
MSTWKWPWRVRPETPPAVPPTDESAAFETQVRGTLIGARPDCDSVDDLPTLYREWGDTRMNLELDDGFSVPVTLNDHNASGILEVTQRARESRDRERASVPPVYNFGGDSAWE